MDVTILNPSKGKGRKEVKKNRECWCYFIYLVEIFAIFVNFLYFHIKCLYYFRSKYTFRDALLKLSSNVQITKILIKIILNYHNYFLNVNENISHFIFLLVRIILQRIQMLLKSHLKDGERA